MTFNESSIQDAQLPEASKSFGVSRFRNPSLDMNTKTELVSKIQQKIDNSKKMRNHSHFDSSMNNSLVYIERCVNTKNYQVN